MVEGHKNRNFFEQNRLLPLKIAVNELGPAENFY